MKRIGLANETFELRTSNMHNVAPITGCNRQEIFDCYGRPSQAKISIWNYWCDWCDRMNLLGWECGIQIDSYNGFQFTITGSVRNEFDINIRITKAHNYAYTHK